MFLKKGYFLKNYKIFCVSKKHEQFSRNMNIFLKCGKNKIERGNKKGKQDI